MSDPETDARARMELAWATRRASFDASTEERESLLARARDELEAVASECRDGGAPTDLAHALHLLAHVETDRGDHGRALELWSEAVATLRGTDDALALAHKVRHLGDAYARADRVDEAEAFYAEALALYRVEVHAAPIDVANTLRRVALLLESRGDHDAARPHWIEARELYGSIGLDEGVAESDEHLAD